MAPGGFLRSAGLLLLRESSAPLRVYSTAAVLDALTERYPLLTMLEHYSGVDWHELRPGEATPLEGTSLAVETFPTGGDAPRSSAGAASTCNARRGAQPISCLAAWLSISWSAPPTSATL